MSSTRRKRRLRSACGPSLSGMEETWSLSPEVAQLLGGCHLIEFAVKPAIHIEKREFAILARTMERLGGRWLKARQAFVFPAAAPISELMREELQEVVCQEPLSSG